MFWNTIGLDYIVDGIELEKKVANPDVTLFEVLDDVNCFQEIRNRNTNVLSYFKKETVFREMMEAVLCPKLVDSPFDKNKYKFSHQCCEALSLAAHDFYQEFIKYPSLVELLLNFLQNDDGNLNHLNVSFYSRLVINFLIADTYSFLPILEKSDFFEHCIDNLEFCSIFELLCSVANCFPEPFYRNRVKQKFASRLLELLVADKPSETHENASALWIEFVKALRDAQYNVERSKDELLESLQSTENIRQLLLQMFPDDGSDFCLSVIVNGCNIVNVLLETNYITDSPADLINRDVFPYSTGSITEDLHNSLSNSVNFSIDSDHIVVSICCDYLEQIVRLVIILFQKNEDSDDALIGCTQVIVNLLNTNCLAIHSKLLQIFRVEKTHFKHFINFINSSCSSFSIFNNYITTMISYILYSTTGIEMPLIDFLISEYNLPRVIRNAVEGEDSEINRLKNIYVSNIDRLPKLVKKTFFLQLANRLVQCQLNSSQSGHIELLMKSLQDYDIWLEFSACLVETFVNRNKSDQILWNTTRSSNSIEIDEIKDLPFFMDDMSPHNSSDVQNKVSDIPISSFAFENLPNLSLGAQGISTCTEGNVDMDNVFSNIEDCTKNDTFFADFASAFGESTNSSNN